MKQIKHLIILLLSIILIIEYKTGYTKSIIVDSYKIGKTTTVLKIGHHRKYIDMRIVERIYEVPTPLNL